MDIALHKLVARVAQHWRIGASGLEALGAIAVGSVLGLLMVFAPLAVFALLFSVAVVLIVLLRPDSLGYLIIAGTIFTSGMARGGIVPMLRPNELILAASSALAALLLLPMPQRPLDLGALAPPVGAFVCLFLGTTFLPLVTYSARGVQFTPTDIVGLAWTLQYVLLLVIFALVTTSDSERLGLLICMIGCGTVVAFVGLLQAAQVGPIVSLLQTWYSSRHALEALEASRVTSLIGSWNALGMFLMANILIGWMALSHVTGLTMRLLLLTSLATCAVCLLASGSFAGMLTLIIGLLIFEVMTGRGASLVPKLLLGSILAALIAVALQPVLMPLIERRMAQQYAQEGWTRGVIPATLSYRFWVWRDVFWPHITANLLFGAYLEVPTWFDWQYEESQYVMLLFRYGLLGTGFYMLWVLITLVWLYRRIQRRQGLNRDIAAMAFTLLILMSIAGLTNPVMSYSGVADYMWVFFGLVASSKAEEQA